MLQTQTALTYFSLPEDRDAAHAATINQVDTAKISYQQFMYGLTDMDLAAAYLRAHLRGVAIRLLLDHTQACGPAEAKLLHWMMLNGFPVTQVTITTSQFHQISHRKLAIIDAGADVPDQQFITVDDASKAGYPRIIDGSLNYSPTGLRQTNSLYIIPSKVLAADGATRFEELWLWANTTEAAYQNLGASPVLPAA